MHEIIIDRLPKKYIYRSKTQWQLIIDRRLKIMNNQDPRIKTCEEPYT